MRTLSLVGATSVQYRKFAPENPIGIKKLNKKMKNADAICAGWLLFGILDAIARASIQHAMPVALNIKSLRRPKRSIVKKATKQAKNFHVSAPPDIIRDVSALIPRPCWKIIWNIVSDAGLYVPSVTYCRVC